MAQVNAAATTYAIGLGMGGGVVQDVSGNPASATFSNTGSVVVTTSVNAKADESTFALGQATGLTQQAWSDADAESPTSASVAVGNDGVISAGVQVVAGGLNGAQSTYEAVAVAGAHGIEQTAGDADMLATSLTNSSSIVADADASATGGFASASASAVGYSAELRDSEGVGTATFLNESTGAITANASATAAGGEAATAGAWAVGVDIGSTYDLANLQLDAVNDGLIAASALATSTGGSTLQTAEAAAAGVQLDAWGSQQTGTFTNSQTGVITAGAVAVGAEGSAEAVGIESSSFASSLYITNRGLVSAYAEGPMAMATGIRIDGGEVTSTDLPLIPTPLPVATVENHGDIWAGISIDGGQTVLRGNAIMTENAPNPVSILLENDDPANIFGNIDIGPDDQIIVQNGHTKFDGIINPDLVLEGNLTIRSDGKFSLLNNNSVEGPSKVYVDGFDMGKRGTLQLHLTEDNSPGAYPTITGNVANLRGKLAAHYQTGVLFDDKVIYDNVIVAGTRNGEFEKVVDNSILLKTIAIYNDDQNVDLKVKRVAFDDVSGLTKNQKAAASGIEKVYDDLPSSGPFSNIVKDLFSLSGAEYAAAMDQLAGAEYAQLMQSVLRSNGQINGTITDRMDCAIEPNPLAEGADARKGCFDPNKVQVWAQVGGGWNTSDGDSEAPGYDETQTAIYVGGDYAINTNVFVGLAGGYFNSSMDFDEWGGRNGASIDYDGGQIALYGGYDDGTWYGRNILSYGFYSGTSRRDFGITSTPQALKGEFDTNVVSYYGEAGRRFQLMDNVGATPFLGIGLASAGIGDFTEKDPNGTGAALRIRGSDASSVASTLGFRVNGHWGGFRPELTLAWQHEFADARQTVDMAYAGAPKGANFSVVSSDPGADALLVGAGISYAVSRASVLTVRYDGSFWSGYNSQELIARFTSKF
jgi:outer membrane autotransporter protein